MIVTVGHTKGGVGKTCLALQVALGRALAGKDVLLVDADVQGSAQTAIAIRGEAGTMPALACTQLTTARMLRAQLAAQAQHYGDIVIDAGGRDSDALRMAIGLSDTLLVPVQPRAVDVWALRDIARLVGEAQAAREADGKPPLRALAVLNMADPGVTSDNTDTAAALADYPQITMVGGAIRRRKSLANATAYGLAVTEITPRDSKACEEVSHMLNILFPYIGA